MFCPECGSQLSEAATFCEECGAKVGLSSPVQPQSSRPQIPHRASPLVPSAGTTQDVSVRGGPRADYAESGSAAQQNPQLGRVFSLSGLGLIVLALFLPWIMVSCGGLRVEFEGHRLLLGTTGEKTRGLEQQINQMAASLSARPNQAQSVRGTEQPSTPLILWFFVTALGAAAVGFTFKRSAATAGLLGFLIGAALLYEFYSSTNQQLQVALTQSLGLIQIDWGAGFWAACLGTGLVGVGAAIRLSE